MSGWPKADGRPWLVPTLILHFVLLAVTASVLVTKWHEDTVSGLLSRRLPKPGALMWQDRMPWSPMLMPQELARAVEHYGSGERIRNVANKLLAGQPIQVVLLGGSVTVGWGATDPAFAYARRFAQLLNASFPHRHHVVLNRAVSGARSSLSTACLDRMVPPNTDLVVVEFTVNDSWLDSMTGPDRRQFEQLLRKLLRLGPAVVVLHHYMFNVVHGATNSSSRGLFWWPTQQHYSTFAQYYDIPSVSLACAAWRLMAAGVEGFQVGKYAARPGAHIADGGVIAGDDERASYFYSDTSHPGDQGHKVLAEALAAPLMRAVGEVQAQRLLPPAVLSALMLPAATVGKNSSGASYGRADPRLSGLPPPMIPGNHEKRTLLCAMPADMKRLVKAASGFQYRAERPNATDFATQKWGWSGYNPGDWLELEIDTRMAGTASSNASQHVVVALSYLDSYEHMGVAQVACTSGCHCESQRFDATWLYKVSVSYFREFLVTQHQQCRIRVTILKDAGAVPSGEHKFVVTAAVIREQ